MEMKPHCSVASVVKSASGGGAGDKPDILWPKVAFSRETAWVQEEQFQRLDHIEADVFKGVAADFANLADDGFNDLAAFCDGPGSSKDPLNCKTGFPAILDGTITSPQVKGPPHEECFFSPRRSTISTKPATSCLSN